MSVFFVAIPLCLGIAMACNMPMESGLISGISGGIVTGLISGSHTSVSGPSAGFVSVVIDASSHLGGYSQFLLALVIAGFFQIIFGIAKLGRLSNYIPSSVINGLMVAIGMILFLKQIPHLVGYESVPSGDFDFIQRDHHNTFSTIIEALEHIDLTATLVGLISLVLLFWMDGRQKGLIKFLPPSLLVVIIGAAMSYFANSSNIHWLFVESHKFVRIPDGSAGLGISHVFHHPNFTHINLEVVKYAVLIAVVTSLEAMLGIQAGDKLDKQKRHTPKTREMVAQGCGNIVSGMLGGIPITSVVVRTSVNVTSGARTKVATIVHGVLMLFAMLIAPKYINLIPMSCLAAILIFSSYKLIVSTSVDKLYKKGLRYFIPFVATVLCILFSNVLIGVAIGLALGLIFVIRANYVKSFSYVAQKYHAGEVLRIALPQEISFLNKPSLVRLLDSIPDRSSVVIDAGATDYIDHDALEAFQEFTKVRARLHHIKVSTVGFKKHYNIENRMHITATVSKETQVNTTPAGVLAILKEGNKRFRSSNRMQYDFRAQVRETSTAQNPLAVILSCMDSRATPEIIFDLGIGEVLSIRIAGNVANEDIIGSMEFGCSALGAKLIVVLGHTSCGAVNAACSGIKLGNATSLINKIEAIAVSCNHLNLEKSALVDEVARINVNKTAQELIQSSTILKEMIGAGKIAVVSAMYDVKTGKVLFEV